MNLANLLQSLEQFGQMLPSVVAGISDSDSRWKPKDGSWSILEIVAHLADEEADDFHKRMTLILAHPENAWPLIDPEKWAIERRYNEGDLTESLQRFTSLREESVRWLRSLEGPNWNQAYQHPQFGPFRAGDLLSSWAAHDCLHLRQISKRRYQLVARDAREFSIKYAGDW